MTGKRISIFIDGHTFDKEFQGTHGFIKGLYSALAKNYNNLDFFAGAYDIENIRKELPFIPTANFLSYKKHRYGFSRMFTDIPRHIRKHHFDFAHFQYISPAMQSGCRYIVTLHDILFNEYPQAFPVTYRLARNYFFKKSIRNASIRTTVSAYSRSSISRHFNLPLETINLIPSSPEKDFGTKYTAKEAADLISNKYGIQNFILYVSRIEPRKNQLLLLEKYLQLKLYDQKISLVFIGKQSLHDHAFEKLLQQALVQHPGLIYWLEQVSGEYIEAFYKSCRLFVYPSRAEGFGLPPLEAALCKVPVLCSKATAMNDYCFFEPFFFDPGNEIGFEEMLMSILHAPPTALQLERIAQQVLEKYAWEKTAAQFYQLLITAPTA